MQYRPGKIAAAAALTLVAALASVAVADGRPTASGPASQAVAMAPSCRTPQIAIMAPITGANATIGVEQRSWARYAVRNFNTNRARLRNQRSVPFRRFRLLEFDTQLDAARASTEGQRIASNRNILGVVGPAGSQEVISVDPIFTRARLGFVSGSATRTTLTNGSVPTFFRVVPNDSVQGPTVGRYLARTLRARRVVVIDDQTAYGQPLADSIAATLRAANVNASRESVNVETTTDFSTLVTRVPTDADFVVLAWQTAAKAQTFGQQLRQQGRRARIFGTDGLFQPGQFTIDNSLVSSFAPDIRNIATSRKFVTGFQRLFPNVQFGTFGPPTYAATQAVIDAVNNACRDGRVTRAEVVTHLRRTSQRGSILGGNLSFTARGDVRGAKFYIFEIRNGQYVTVG